MSRPFFSINIPTRNRAAMLRTAIKSLLWQTCGDFECLVMDDGSSDDTPKVFQEFSKDPRFLWRRFEQHQGVTFGRNYAVGRAKGRFIAFLDDDDIWLPHRLAEFKKAAEGALKAGFIFSNAYLWRYDRIIGTVFDPKREIPEGRLPGYYAIGEQRLPYVTSHMAISREAIERVGLFRPELNILADTEMVVRVIAAGFPVQALREPMAIRRLHDAQVTLDHEKAFRESEVVLQTAAAPAAMDRQLRRQLLIDTATYTLKNLDPVKARRFLEKRYFPRDSRFYGLYALSFLPVSVLTALRRLRKAYLGSGPRDRKEFAQAEALVRTIL